MARKLTFGIGPEFLQRDQLQAGVVAPWEDGQRAGAGPGSFEWWYFDAHLDDGSIAVIVFATKPLLERGGPLKPTLLFTITRPDGQKIDRSKVYPADQFSASSAGCEVQIGANQVRGDLHTYTLQAANDGLAADLTFTSSLPAWRPGNGKNYYDTSLQRYFAWLPAIPYGTVSGALTYDGQVHAVTGSGYHDHNWGNVGLNDVLSHWIWGRARLGEYTLIFVEMTTTGVYGWQKIPVFLLARGDQVLVEDGRPLTLQTAGLIAHPDGRQYPQDVDFHWAVDGGGAVHIKLRRPDLIEATSLLASFPPWKRRLMRMLANPYYFRFNAALELSVVLPGVRALEQGRALYELMLLR